MNKGREVSQSGPGGWTVDLVRCPRCPSVWLCPGPAALSSRGGRGVAKHLQALLSSTLTARGLIAPVRFIWEAAEGASCSFTAPRLGFSSTRCLAFGQMNGDRDSYPYAETSVWIHSTHCPLLAPGSQRKAILRSPSFGGRIRPRRNSPRKDTGMRCSLPSHRC